MMEEGHPIARAAARISRLAEGRQEMFKDPDAIKAQLVMPVLHALGYDPYDPDQVVVGHRGDEGRADFATMGSDGRISMLVATTSQPEDLDTPRARQLIGAARSDGLLAALTNGRMWRIHRIEHGDVLPDPMLAIDLTMQAGLDPFLHITREGFDLDACADAIATTRLPSLVWEALVTHVSTSDRFASEIEGMVHGVSDAERTSEAIRSAMERAGGMLRGADIGHQAHADTPPITAPQVDEDDERRPLTGDEKAAFEIVCRLAGQHVDKSRIEARPAQTYLACLLDHNNRRPICRLYLTSASARYIGTFKGRDETKHRIQAFTDVSDFAVALEERLRELDPGAFAIAAERADAPSGHGDEGGAEPEAGHQQD